MLFLAQMVEEEMEGNVVMVTLGAEGGVESVDEGQEASYMELKPSTTLLVPMELMEGHEGLVGCSQLGQPELQQVAVQDEPTSETQGSFSLMLDVDDEVKEAEVPPLNDDQELSPSPTLSPAVKDDDEPVAQLEVILLSKDAQDAPVLAEEQEQEQREETDIVDRADVERTSADVQNTDANPQPEDDQATLDAGLMEDKEPAGLLMPEASPLQDLPEDVIESVAVDEEERRRDDETEALQKEPEENGTVEMDTDVGSISEVEAAASAAVEKDDHKAETEEDSEDMKTDTEPKKSVGRPRKQKHVKEEDDAASVRQVVEEPVEEAPALKSVPSTPTRRTTRGKSVTFISPLTEEKEELQEDENLVEARSTRVAASPRRTPRKSKQNKEPALTPRRSTRRARLELPEDEPVGATDRDADATSKSSSPGRRRVSQETGSTRAFQSGDEVESSATEVGVSEDDGAGTEASRRSSSKTPTPSKRRTTQSSTPRRSSRKIPGSTDVVSIPLEIVKEENEREDVFTPPVKHASKKSMDEAAELQPVLLEVEEQRKEQASSPGRTTRRSSRNTGTVYSQVRTLEL